MGDLSEEREGGSRGPGRVPWGGVRQIESAQTLPRAESSGCSDAQGCPECGQPIAQRLCLGVVALVLMSKGIIPGNACTDIYYIINIQVHTYTYIYC